MNINYCDLYVWYIINKGSNNKERIDYKQLL